MQGRKGASSLFPVNFESTTQCSSKARLEQRFWSEKATMQHPKIFSTSLSTPFFWLRLAFPLLLLSCLSACQQAELPRLRSQQRSIINGSPDLRFPAVGVLVRDRTPFCSATLITPRLVLTAGHCIDLARIAAMGQNKLEFRIDTPVKPDSQRFQSAYFPAEPRLLSTHPRWNPEQLLRGFDVGLVLLQKPVPSTLATPIPVRTTALPQVPSLLFQGYGLIQSVGHPVSPNRKMSAQLPIVKIDRDRITSEGLGKSICHGDSGGPALLVQNGKVEVVAVNSYGETAGVPDSRPYRSRCDGRAVSIRTDAVAAYLVSWMQRLGGDGKPCQKQSDCAGCQQCQQGRCVSNYPKEGSTFCKPCRSDSDCGQGGQCRQIRGVYRCSQPCSQGCCPAALLCIPGKPGGQCLPSQCPDARCQTDADCGKGESCKEQKCVLKTSAPQAKLCHPCKQNADCGPGALCQGRQVGGQCLQSCDKDGLCPAGFLCKTRRPGFPAQCVPSGERCPLSCDAKRPCPGGFSCKSGRCKRDKGGGDVGDDCELTTCQPGLWCVSTVLGKRCLQACHLSAGRLGGACRGDSTCAAGSTCLPFRGLRRKFCMAQCKTSADCPLGGTCASGHCYCSQDTDCKDGFVCEKGFGNTSSGFCVNPKQLRACPSGFQCRFHVQGSFCFPDKVQEDRNMGQPCNDKALCHNGLNCMALRNHAGICSENCRDNAVCKLGGTCYQGECLCSADSACPKGRRCQLFAFIGGRPRGVCIVDTTQTTSVPCLDNDECGQGYRCEQGQCQVGRREQEPATEPAAEPLVEPRKEPTTQEPIADEPVVERDAGLQSKESGRKVEKTLKDLEPQDGCQCQASGTPSSTWLVGWLVCLFWIRRRSKRTR